MQRPFILVIFIVVGGTQLADGALLNVPVLATNGRSFPANEGIQIKDKIVKVQVALEPLSQLNENLANCAALEASANFWLERGQQEKAIKSLRTLVMLLRNTSTKYGSLAMQEINAGHTLAGLENIAPHDNLFWNGPATPAQLLGIALGLKDGTAYWNEIVRQTEHAPISEPTENLYTDYVDMGKGMKACTTHR